MSFNQIHNNEDIFLHKTQILELLFSQTVTLIWRRLKHVKAAPGRLVGIILNPLVMLFAVGYLFVGALNVPGNQGAYIDYLTAGIAAQACLAGMGPTGVSVRLDADSGFMDRLRSLPLGRGIILFSHSIADLLISLLAVLVMLIISYAMGWRSESNIEGFFVGLFIIMFFAYATVWLGVAVGLTVSNPETVDAFTSLLLIILTFFSSAILMPTALPQWLQPIVEWNPVSAVSAAVRSAWGNPMSPALGWAGSNAYILAIFWIFIFIIVSATIAHRRFKHER